MSFFVGKRCCCVTDEVLQSLCLSGTLKSGGMGVRRTVSKKNHANPKIIRIFAV